MHGRKAARSRLCLGKLAVPRKGLTGVSEVVYRLSQASAEKLDGSCHCQASSGAVWPPATPFGWEQDAYWRAYQEGNILSGTPCEWGSGEELTVNTFFLINCS